MPKSPEQIAYDAANAAYQKSWRRDDDLREAMRRAHEDVLNAPYDPSSGGHPMIFETFLKAREALRAAEEKTATLLAMREGVYRKLIESA